MWFLGVVWFLGGPLRRKGVPRRESNCAAAPAACFRSLRRAALSLSLSLSLSFFLPFAFAVAVGVVKGRGRMERGVFGVFRLRLPLWELCYVSVWENGN